MRLLCRGSDSDSAIATQWREHMLSSLAGGDLALVEDLWGADLDLADLLPRLSAFGAERGWTAESLRDWGAEEWTANGLMRRYDEVARPPEAGRTLWAQGALYWTPEYGPELHTAALALLGWREELKHRCWRGQAALLLPMLDDLRLQICADLTRRYDRDWPLMWYRTGAAEEAELTADPFACEWRWLERALSYCPDRQTKGRWLEAARQARLLRNELAHYRPISFTHFSFFAQELRRPRY